MGRGNDSLSGNDHMPYLRAIWNAPFDPIPLLRYADWLAMVHLVAAAEYYREKAELVANGRLRPDYVAPLDIYLD
jgi:hypothetical protein